MLSGKLCKGGHRENDDCCNRSGWADDLPGGSRLRFRSFDNSVLRDIDGYLRRYARCVSDSKGHDDCSTEFRRLKYAQDDFETAVSEYQSYCRD
jgi:hypothetical protein